MPNTRDSGAWVTCEHDVKITAGPDQNSMKPTGKHPECFREFLAELMGLDTADVLAALQPAEPKEI